MSFSHWNKLFLHLKLTHLFAFFCFFWGVLCCQLREKAHDQHTNNLAHEGSVVLHFEDTAHLCHCCFSVIRSGARKQRVSDTVPAGFFWGVGRLFCSSALLFLSFALFSAWSLQLPATMLAFSSTETTVWALCTQFFILFFYICRLRYWYIAFFNRGKLENAPVRSLWFIKGEKENIRAEFLYAALIYLRLLGICALLVGRDFTSKMFTFHLILLALNHLNAAQTFILTHLQPATNTAGTLDAETVSDGTVQQSRKHIFPVEFSK